jgi:putative two-component system response regulator
MSVSREKREVWAEATRAPHRVLVVDDEPHVAKSLSRLLEQQGYATARAAGTAEARRLLADEAYELMLCDVRMPDGSGLELAELAASEHPDMAVVMVSGFDDRHVAETALDLGAFDYVLKPFRPNEVFIAVANALRRRRAERAHRTDRQRMSLAILEHRGALRCVTADMREQRAALQDAHRETVARLARVAELRHTGIGDHLERVGRYTEVLARRLGLAEERCADLGGASRLHNVGKIAGPDHILAKRGRLTDDERAVVEQHAATGHSLLTDAHDELLELAATIALTHHERIDGRGYPHGLIGDAIPLEGRIVAIADAYDALTSDRPYRRAQDARRALEELEANAGSQFDARLVELFVGCADRLAPIAGPLHARRTAEASVRGPQNGAP